MPKRPYRPVESRLVSEWVYATFPQAHVIFRAYLGAFDAALQDAAKSEAELRALGVWRRYADALVALPDEVHLVEAKVRGTPGVLEQLDLYARLFPLSPDYQHLLGRTVVRDLVWAIADPVIEGMARERGIRVHLFHPPWVDEYLATLRPRDRTPTLPGGLKPGES